MPLFEYVCNKCNFRFEELKSQKEDSATTPCKNCGGISDRQISSFSPVMAGGSSNETADMTIGREADKRWQSYNNRQEKRRGDKALQNFNLPKTKDGKFMPIMALGDKRTVENRKEYVGALQKHRKERTAKGISQFNSVGAF